MAWYASRLIRALACTCCLVLAVPAAHATPPEPLQVLLLHSYDDSTEPYVAATEAFKQRMQQIYTMPISFREVNLEERREHGGDREQLLEKLLAQLHTMRAPDLIAAIGPPAISFWLRHRDRLFPEVPLVIGAGEGRFFTTDLRPGDYGVMTRFFFPDLVEDFLHLRPATTRILMVFGATPYERRLAAFIRAQFEDFKYPVSFEYTNDLSLDELITRVEALKEDAAVFYGLFISDPEGVTLQHGSALPMIRQVSEVPVIGALENQLGRGIVGGRLLQLRRIGSEMANAAQTLLAGPAAEPGWQTIELSPPVYDWRELRAFGIDISRLPPDSSVQFEPQSSWSRYRGWIALTAAVLLLQSLLIALLLLERRRRRSAESMQASLSGKLISAHEDERRRIARELHDDLSQRLARLSIDVGTLNNGQTGTAASGELQQLHSDLVEISKDCHDISYRLHPSLLEDLGLVTALRSECQSVRKQTSANLMEDIGDIEGSLSRDAALCAYRIVQEALYNAVKHAEARTIEIALHQEGDAVVVRVQDDGRGFLAAADHARAGLGLSGMRERARLIDAKLHIDSTPGQGTTVTVTVPMQGTNR